MARITLINSATKKEWTIRKEENSPINSPVLPRKIPGQERPGEPLETPSLLILI